MIESRRVLGVIPARGGSKGIPRKNIQKIADFSLVQMAVVAASLVPEIDRLVVSTDDPEIAKVATQHGAEIPYLRPAELATDITPMVDVIEELVLRLQQEGDVYEYVLLLQPTTPFRVSGNISKALHLLDVSSCADSCISLSEVVDLHPKRIRRIVNGFVSGYLGDKSDTERQQRQDHVDDKAFKRSGTFYISRVKQIIGAHSLFGAHILPFLVRGPEEVNIDDEFDLLLARAIWENRGDYPAITELCEALERSRCGGLQS
jgi:CMP-N,N'-diacetyllegionaminic acid synthase